MAELDRPYGSGEPEGHFAARRRASKERYRAEGMARGIEQGIEQGIERGLLAGQDLLRRQAARKFDDHLAGKLTNLLAGIDDTEDLARAGELIIDCATGEELIDRLANYYREASYTGTRRGSEHRWKARRLIDFDLGFGEMAVVDRLHESDELEDYFVARRGAYQERYRAEGMALGIERGIERGLEQGLSAERELLRRLAARKFDPHTAARFANVLADIDNTVDLARAGELVIDCATAEELIARLGNGSLRGSRGRSRHS